MNPARNSGFSRTRVTRPEVRVAVVNLQSKVPCKIDEIRGVARLVLRARKVCGPGLITICLVDDPVITAMHARYLGAHSPTDVISFVSRGAKKGEPLGADIAISMDTAVRQAAQFCTCLRYEVNLYAVHGVLHVLGFDDKTKRAQERMQKKCEYYLRKAKVDKCLSIKPKP